MRKVFLCTLVVFGLINFCFGQVSTNLERIFVKTYDSEGVLEQFRLNGDEALNFDIPAYIMENDDSKRVLINGTFKSGFLTRTIKFDSNNAKRSNGDYVCSEVDAKLTPFLGVWGPVGKADQGVRVNSVVPGTSAEKAGVRVGDRIKEFDGIEIGSFTDLKKTVLSSEIGDKVELKFQNKSQELSKYVTIGSRGVETVSYNYCQVEPSVNLDNNTITATAKTDEASLRSYPNPTSSISHVDFQSSSKEDVILKLTDISGRVIQTEVFSDFDGSLELDYNLDNESNGTYIMTIQQGKEKYTRKIQLIKE